MYDNFIKLILHIDLFLNGTSFVNYKKGCTRLAPASDEVYQLLAHGRWFSPGTPAFSTTKIGRYDIAESGVKHNKSNQIKSKWNHLY